MRIRPSHLFQAAFGLLALMWIATRFYVVTRVPKLVVGPETTVVTGPILPDGTLDFEAAMHARFSVGVTPENNAVVLLQRAVGPRKLDPELRRRTRFYLDSPDPPATGDYVVTHSTYCSTHFGTPIDINYFDQLTAATGRKWSRHEFPEIASWIDANQKPLKLIEEASRRSRFYSPYLICEGWPLGGFDIQNLREVTRLLVARALLRISERDFENASKDVLTSHRLACLLRQDVTMISQLVAVACDSTTGQAEQVLLAQPLSEAAIQRFRNELSTVSFLYPVTETLDQGERLHLLATLQEIRQGNASLNEGFDQLLPYIRFDVSASMRLANQYFDALVKAQKIAGIRQRYEEVARIQYALRSKAFKDVSVPGFLNRIAWHSGQSLGDSTAGITVALLVPAVEQFQSAMDRARTRRELLDVGLALAAYHARHGMYPKSLDALSPEFLANVPLDRYACRSLRYQVKPDGYLLYSIGPNEIDNGGRTREQGHDDIPFQAIHEVPVMP